MNVMRRLKAPSIPRWLASERSKATSHFFSHEDHGLVAIVCLDGWQDLHPIEVAGLLVHEAVHVWQEHCDSIGERSPGSEQEAYAIQAISQELMAEFARRLQSDQSPVTRRT